MRCAHFRVFIVRFYAIMPSLRSRASDFSLIVFIFVCILRTAILCLVTAQTKLNFINSLLREENSENGAEKKKHKATIDIACGAAATAFGQSKTSAEATW